MHATIETVVLRRRRREAEKQPMCSKPGGSSAIAAAEDLIIICITSRAVQTHNAAASAGHVHRRLTPLSLICTLACNLYGMDEQAHESVQVLYWLEQIYQAFGVIISEVNEVTSQFVTLAGWKLSAKPCV